MFIDGDGLLGESGRSFVGLSALAECKESAGVEPEHARIVVISGHLVSDNHPDR